MHFPVTADGRNRGEDSRIRCGFRDENDTVFKHDHILIQATAKPFSGALYKTYSVEM